MLISCGLIRLYSAAFSQVGPGSKDSRAAGFHPAVTVRPKHAWPEERGRECASAEHASLFPHIIE